MVTQPYLKKVFDYDPDGFLIWKINKGRRTRVGDKAGTYGSDYAKVKLNGKNYLVHRLVFLWHNGFLPTGLDHRDRNCWNNRITNLRSASQEENCRNTKIYKNNQTGLKGVFFFKKHKKFHASIGVRGRVLFLGSFNLKQNAAKAYNQAAKKYHGKFAVLNRIESKKCP